MKLLNARQVSEMVGIARPTIYARMKHGDFPRPLKLSARAARWRKDEIEEWIESRPRGGNQSRAA